MSALDHELERARTEGTLEAVRLATRRRPRVTVTVTPGDTRGQAMARALDEITTWSDLETPDAR